MQVSNDELLSARELAREYPGHLNRLKDGEIDKLVVMVRGEMEAVVLRLEDYEWLLREAEVAVVPYRGD